MISIGVVGMGGHARRIKEILDRRPEVSSVKHYHPNKKVAGLLVTNNLPELLQCDAIFIVSPNETHFEYLTYLEHNFHGYIFCEKPPVVSREQLSLLNIDPRRTYFNFNYRFSDYYYQIKEEIDSGRLGTPVSAFVAVTHGLAYKKEYPASWRALSKTHHLGIMETVSIHFIDLFIYLFGAISGIEKSGCIISGQGEALDTATVRMSFDAGLELTIFASYATPFSERLILYGTNGILDFNNDSFTSQSPRDVFDSYGYFISPPQQIKSVKDIYLQSLERSIDYFLDACQGRLSLSPDHLDASIRTCKALL